MSLMTRLRRRDEDIHAIVQKILPKEPRKIPDCCVDINHPMHWVTCEAVLEDPTHAKKVIPYFRVYLKRGKTDEDYFKVIDKFEHKFSVLGNLNPNLGPEDAKFKGDSVAAIRARAIQLLAIEDLMNLYQRAIRALFVPMGVRKKRGAETLATLS